MLRIILLATAGLTLGAASALSATPAFSAHKNGTNQTVTQDTDVKLTWSTEGFDTNNNFASNRFTPTVAGKYLIVVSAQCMQAGACMPSIYKNGALVARSQATNINIGQTPQVTTIVDMNGSTDYVEAFINSASAVIGGTLDRTYFSGMQLDGSGGGAGSSQWSDGSSGAIYYNSGNVGIGTTAPSAPLHIVPSGGENSATLLSGFMAGSSLGNLFTGSQFGSLLQGGYSGRTVIGLRENDAGDSFTIVSGGGNYTADNTYDTVLLHAQANGNVGIGTTNPSSKLDVNGTVRADTIIAAPPSMILADERTSGTAAGGCTSGAWSTRTLNTQRANTISGASLASNEFTLPAGTYSIDAEGNTYETNRYQTRLYNVTDAAVTVYGTNVYSAGSSATPSSRIKTIFSIAAPKAFRIEARCNTTKATNGHGVEVNFGGTEVYGLVELTKLQ